MRKPLTAFAFLSLVACAAGPATDKDTDDTVSGDTDDTQVADTDGDTDDTQANDTDDTQAGDTDVADPDADQDGYLASVDCDDGDDSIHPGADELFCDAIDQDCADGDEVGIWWYPSTGAPRLDMSADFAAGTSQFPAAISLDDGELQICGGMHYVEMTTGSVTTIRGFDNPSLRGVFAHDVITVPQDGELAVSDLTIRDTQSQSIRGGTGTTIHLDHLTVSNMDRVVYLGDDSTLTVSSSAFDHCRGGAVQGGLGMTVTVQNTTFDANGEAAGGTGAAISVVNGTLVVESSTFTNNLAETGGAIYSSGSVVEIGNSTFRANQATRGGAVEIWSNTTTSIYDNTFDANIAAIEGGGLRTLNVSGEVTGNLFTGNTAGSAGGGFGGGFDSAGTESDTLTLSGNTFAGNSGSAGGGWANHVTATSTGDTFNDNTASNGGGGAALVNGTATFVGGDFSRNSAGALGGGGVLVSRCTAGGVFQATHFHTGADSNTPNDVQDVSGDTYGSSTLDLTCALGECAGGTNACENI